MRYALLSGNYTTQKQAIAAIDYMLRYIDMQQPLARKVDVIQKQIAQYFFQSVNSDSINL